MNRTHNRTQYVHTGLTNILLKERGGGEDKEGVVESEGDRQMETEKRGACSIATMSKGAGISR